MLRSIYRSYEDVDLLIGGTLERHETDALVGPTFLCINLIQFHDLRMGDRYFFENGKQPYPFTPGMLHNKSTSTENSMSYAFPFIAEQLDEIRKASAARLMCYNADIKHRAFEVLCPR